jgi:DnaJ-class molecular chaperone
MTFSQRIGTVSMACNRDLLEYYSVLGIESSATAEQVMKAFETKAQDLHPDRNPSPDATLHLEYFIEAFQALSSPHSRADYDAGAFATVADAHSPTLIR